MAGFRIGWTPVSFILWRDIVLQCVLMANPEPCLPAVAVASLGSLIQVEDA